MRSSHNPGRPAPVHGCQVAGNEPGQSKISPVSILKPVYIDTATDGVGMQQAAGGGALVLGGAYGEGDL